MQTAEKELTAKQAIEIGFAKFDEFFEAGQKKNVLLEGVQYLDDGHFWLITIGFDAGRAKEIRNPFLMGDLTKEPIREIREFVLNASDGSFVRMG